ncbi:LANO_0H21616g1_1 [Lachancea nothofagi CBS 11611]|uniref:LANO_0H21616g1_1 n=1 Tax=Lachancea nothofagi CBS 11611 TaxID=1266666 RepID=A0A1G4KND8_9SACH|nr:LANO_0H21616g1_1 [Lachancea nothofagi CBS 11611]
MGLLMKLNPTLPTQIAVKAIVFDMDGTLCIPQTWMFRAMREAVGHHDPQVDILTFVDNLPSQRLRDEANLQIQKVEARAMAEMKPQPGLITLLEYLTRKGVDTSICTRNLITPVRHLISNFVPAEHDRFHHILTREFRPTKPNPDPLLHIAQLLKISPANMIMVGDSYDDMECGAAAGCATILVRNDTNGALLETRGHLIDAVVYDLADIIQLLERGFSKKVRT